MKKISGLIVLIVFFGLFQSTLFYDILSVKDVRVDLLLILVTYIAFKKGSMTGQLTGFGSGLLIDFFSSALFGTFTFTFTVLGFVMGLVQRKVYSDNFITAIVLVFLATIVKGAVLGFLALFFTEVSLTFVSYIKNGLLLELIINPIMAGPMYWLLNRFAAPIIK